ncbi:MAG: hypothetical protein K0U93_17055 [Gammaproteobacteria bacterium]|nr:hypothetical protein [Gammaproteobacteria bacterium]
MAPIAPATFIPAGYLRKSVVTCPGWLANDGVDDIYSVSGCVSSDFVEDYVPFWGHNGYWLFDSPEEIDAVANQAKTGLNGTTLFYYELYPYAFVAAESEPKPMAEGTACHGRWEAVSPESSLSTSVAVPKRRQLWGYDIVTHHNGPGCSPLSCNSLATQIAVNRHCLLPTLDATTSALIEGRVVECEPGPYRIYAVYRPE